MTKRRTIQTEPLEARRKWARECLDGLAADGIDVRGRARAVAEIARRLPRHWASQCVAGMVVEVVTACGVTARKT